MGHDTSGAAGIAHWQNLTFQDADTMTAWLVAAGFTEVSVHRDPSDPGAIMHGEWVYERAGFMGGSHREGSAGTPPGMAAAYLVTADPDAAVERAVAAGATIEVPVQDKDYGGRGGTVRDPEGNQWSFGTYQPR